MFCVIISLMKNVPFVWSDQFLTFGPRKNRKDTKR